MQCIGYFKHKTNLIWYKKTMFLNKIKLYKIKTPKDGEMSASIPLMFL